MPFGHNRKATKILFLTERKKLRNLGGYQKGNMVLDKDEVSWTRL